jgi:hypothetical protein
VFEGSTIFSDRCVLQAHGGAIAVVVGAYIFNAAESSTVSYTTIAGANAIHKSRITMSNVTFSHCSVISLTTGSTSGSVGSSSVYGGAFALLHKTHVSEFASGLLSSPQPPGVNGLGLTVSILNSTFLNCAVLTNSTSTRPGLANGGGGAAYVNSVALSNFSVRDCVFDSNSVTVACGATGAVSNSSGGALAVEVAGSLHSVAEVTSSSFINCTAQGASIANLAVRGGAVAVFGAASFSVTGSRFTSCNIHGTYSSSSSIDKPVSGGAGVSASLTQAVVIDRCLFDAAGGQDASETSAGLLVLAMNEVRSNVVITQASMKSSSLVLNVRCVTGDSSAPASCPQDGHSVFISDSVFTQQIPHLKEDFNGSSLISFQNGLSPSFINSRLRCVSSLDFAAFKKIADMPPSAVFSCGPCSPFSISLSASEVLLEQLVKEPLADRCRVVSVDNKCPFGVEACSTFVSVARGFWANFSSLTPANLTKVTRCPHGYCNCSSTTAACSLTPLLSIDRKPDPLCSGRRVGFLCGGCPPNHTHSMNDKSCVSDEVCGFNLWWVWTLSILGYAAYSFYIVMSSRKLGDGALSCLLFYFQVSSFAVNPDESDGSLAVLEFAQVRSLLSMYEGACFAPSMTAYGATAAKLSGPLLVLVFTAGWTGIMQALRPRLLLHNIDVSVSFGGTLAAAGLFVFSGVSKVVFTLVECSSYDSEGAIFIDGTVPCKDTRWTVLIIIAALLCVCPLVFAYALNRKTFPQSIRNAVCGKFAEAVFYWGAVTLTFRLLMSVTQFLRVDSPNLMACVRLSMSVGVLVLLVYVRPHARVGTFCVDVACYVCLIGQFSLQTIYADRQYFGVGETSDNRGFMGGLSTSSTVVRFASLPIHLLIGARTVSAPPMTLLQICPRRRLLHLVAAVSKKDAA